MPVLNLDEEAVMQAGTQLMTNGVQGVSQSVGTLAPASVIPPAGMDEVSASASAGHSAFTAAWQAINALMNQEIVLLGAAFHEAVGEYKATDTAGAVSI